MMGKLDADPLLLVSASTKKSKPAKHQQKQNMSRVVPTQATKQNVVTLYRLIIKKGQNQLIQTDQEYFRRRIRQVWEGSPTI